MDEAEVHDAVQERLAEISQVYTAGRKALVRTLVRSKRPLAMDEVIRRTNQLSQSSVYRNVAVLLEAGAVSKVVGSDGSVRLELAEVLSEHHHHLLCTRCGNVSDYSPPVSAERSIGRWEREIMSATGFRPQSHRIDFLGTCPSCS